MKKKLILLYLIMFTLSIILVGCSDASSGLVKGQSLILSKDIPVCSSKENVDLMISYVKNKNESAIKEMELRGYARMLKSGTKVNIIDTGLITEVQTSNGDKWFAPDEIFKQ